jgi:hypothetical protein
MQASRLTLDLWILGSVYKTRGITAIKESVIIPI